MRYFNDTQRIWQQFEGKEKPVCEAWYANILQEADRILAERGMDPKEITAYLYDLRRLGKENYDNVYNKWYPKATEEQRRFADVTGIHSFNSEGLENFVNVAFLLMKKNEGKPRTRKVSNPTGFACECPM